MIYSTKPGHWILNPATGELTPDPQYQPPQPVQCQVVAAPAPPPDPEDDEP